MQQRPGLVLMIVKIAQWPVTNPAETISLPSLTAHSSQYCAHPWNDDFGSKNSCRYKGDCFSVNKCTVELDYEQALDQPNGKNIFK